MGLFRQDDLITRLCRESRTTMIRREGDRYWVQPQCSTRGLNVQVAYRTHNHSVLFQCFLDVSFSLEREPQGLFARLMLRGYELHFGAWKMAIAGSCEASVYVAARLPTDSLDSGLFAAVCRELLVEVEDFHRELHERFQYGVGSRQFGSVERHRPAAADREIRFVEPIPDGLPSADEAWRAIQNSGGAVRYRLPGPGS